MRNTIVDCNDLTVAYREKPVLWDIDLAIPAGVMMAVVGPNGAGKSTLIKTMLQLIKPVAGEVRFFGKPYREVRDRIGYVPQRESVDWDFPTTVFDCTLMGRYGRIGWIRRPSATDRKEALEILEKVGLYEFRNRQISQLSGGQQQRVFLARALMQDADLYFMDEPFQGVDAKTEKAIITVLKDMKANGKTLIVVHHDLQTIRDYFDWITIMNVRIIASGPVEEVYTTENLHTAYGSRVRAKLEA
ncbi:MAG TPA: metal ABC transporter ATP-binding protein [Thermotogota bacterium]|nr:metal ABC transporter ATP-binding protein [Thermotogota bacterium]HPJ88205.1 metal ABC transporter ATP-binding protein [Thermotogota bacterium]HPR95638.1 metal ABC transporter ATP-binding protein [Thermotogota bacterium]